MTMLISWPFRFGGSGSVTVRDDADIDYLGEELAQLIRTEPGERELVPDYGINDPAYTFIDESMLTAQTDQFGPPVNIESVTTTFLSDRVQDVVVKFTPDPQRGPDLDVSAGGEELITDDTAGGDAFADEDVSSADLDTPPTVSF